MKQSYTLYGKPLHAIKTFLFLTFVFFSGSLFSQLGSYTVSQSTGTFTSIVGGVGTTAVTLSSMDDAISAAQNIGFTFTYNSTAFTQFKLNSNGWITFDVAATATTNYSPISGTVNNIIAAFARDLNGNNTTSTTFYIQTAGAVGSRTCTIEWVNIKSFSSTIVPSNGNFQIILNETTNTIDIKYGSFTAGAGRGAGTVQVGLRGTTTGTSDVTAITGSVWTALTSNNSSTATVTINSTAGTLPSNGQTITFTPPSPCTGTPAPGTIPATASVCSGGSTGVNLTVTGYSSGVSGIAFQWEESDDNGVTDPWASAVGGTGSTTASYTTPVLASTRYYRCNVTCTPSTLFDYTNVCTVGVTNCTFDITYTNTGVSYTSIMPASGGTGTVMPGWTSATSGDDNTSTPVSLTGTTFTYQGSPVTGFRVCSNGWMTFNTAITATTFSNSLSSTTQNMVLAPFFDDLVFTGQNYANRDNCVRYQVSGTLGSGSAVITIEWAGMERFNVSGPNLNFQVKLYEAGNVIEYVYGNFEAYDGTVAADWTYSLGYNGTTPAGTTSIDRFALQAGRTNYFSATSDPANNAVTPECYSKYTITPGIYTGPTSTPAIPVPANDNSGSAITLSVGTSDITTPNLCSTYYTSRGATNSGFGAASCATAGNEDDDVWFSFTTNAATDYTIKVKPSPNYDAVIQLLDNTFTPVSCINAVTTTTSSTSTGIETLNATGLTSGGTTYYVRVYHNGAGYSTTATGTGGFSLNVFQSTPPPSNDNCSTPISLTVGTSCTFTSGSTIGATASADAVCTGTADDDVWYSFVATDANPVITVHPIGSFNPVLALYTGVCGSLSNITCTNSFSTGIDESYNATGLTIGQTYYIRIYHFATGTGSGNFQVCVYNPTPSCTSGYSPADLTTGVVTTGVTLSWTAATYASSYDVYFGTSPIPGTYTNTLTNSYPTGILLPSTTYYWSVLPKNLIGGPTSCSVQSFSTVAICTGTPAAGIASTSVNNICSTTNFTLSLSGMSTEDGTTYQWQESSDGISYADISGATSTSYSLTAPDTTSYRCVVICTNSGLSDTTNIVTVNIDPNCVIMFTGTLTTCTGTIYDNGGPSGQYTINQNDTLVIYPGTPGNNIQLAFGSFLGEACCDYIKIFNGPSIASTLLGQFNGGTSPGTQISTDVSGALTVVWHSDVSIVGDGFSAVISCVPNSCTTSPEGGTASANPLSVCSSAPSTTLSLTGATTGLGYTYQWQSSADDISYLDILGAVNSTYAASVLSDTYFRCIVTCSDISESDTSASTLVVVNTSPVGDTQADPVIIGSLPYAITGNNLASNCYTDNTGNLAPDVYYQYTALCNGTISVGVCPHADMNDSYVRLYDALGTQLTFNDDTEPVGCAFTFGSSISWPIVAGETYYIIVEGFGSNQGSYDLTVSETSSFSTFYADDDLDTYGDPLDSVDVCDGIAPSGYVGNNLDCNDADAAVNPTATETCNTYDDDCDGLTDDADPSVIGQSTWYTDADGDGFGDVADVTGTLSCFGGPGLSPDNSDCDDTNSSVNPGASEVCNSIDDDCSGVADDGIPFYTYYLDNDGDTYGQDGSTISICDDAAPSGYAYVGGDCDDADDAVNPAASEVCNGTDDDCNGSVDDGIPYYTFYLDDDADSYGITSSTTSLCTDVAPAGYAYVDGDCDDTNAAVNPAATEVCNGYDDNCDGNTDEGVITATTIPSTSFSFCRGSSFTIYANTGLGYTYQWYKNGGPIAGATGSSYTGSKDGSYHVQVNTAEGCFDVSDPIFATKLQAPNNNIQAPNGLDMCLATVKLKASIQAGASHQWYKDGVAISGATNYILLVTSIGDYYCVITNTATGCVKNTATLTVINSCHTGVEVNADLELYPNPNSGEFTLYMHTTGLPDAEARIEIFNVLGDMVYNQETNLINGVINERISMENNVPAGMYTVKVTVGAEQYIRQIVLQR